MEKKWSLKHRRNYLILEFHFIGSVIGKWKRDTLRWEQGNQINEGKKYANSIASVKSSRVLRQWCKAEDRQKHLPSFYFIKMKWLRKINWVQSIESCADRDTTPLCIILCYLAVSQFRKLLILCMAPISLRKANNNYIRTMAQWQICN